MGYTNDENDGNDENDRNDENDDTRFDNLFQLKFTTKGHCGQLLDTVINGQHSPDIRQRTLVEYLLQNGAEVDAITARGVTALMRAVEHGRCDLTELLLKHGANPNIANAIGVTPLMVAAQNGHANIVEALLDFGANPDAQTNEPEPDECGCAVLANRGLCDAPLSALAVAAERGHTNTVKILLDRGANVNLPIVHHVHGRLLSSRERRINRWSYLGPVSDTSSDSELEPEQWEMRISVSTALTLATQKTRDLLLSRGADPAKEEAMRNCDCTFMQKRERVVWTHDDDDDIY